MVSYGLRWWGLCCMSMGFFAAALWTFLEGYPLASCVLFCMAPSLWLLSFGTLRNRLLNGLPVFTLLIGLYLGFRFGNWEASGRLWTALPFVGLVLKPRRHPLKYATLILTTILLIVDYLLGWTVPWTYRILFIVWIYGIFIPPIIFNRVRTLFPPFKREF